MKTIKFQIDPLEKFESVEDNDLMQACGLIPPWALEQVDQPLQEWMQKRYGFGELIRMRGSTVVDGVYKSPYDEDPDLMPLLYVERGDDKMYQYQYGIVAFKGENDDDWFVARMD